MSILDIFSLIFYYGLVFLCILPFILMISVPMFWLLEYIADNDIWVRKEDRDQ